MTLKRREHSNALFLMSNSRTILRTPRKRAPGAQSCGWMAVTLSQCALGAVLPVTSSVLLPPRAGTCFHGICPLSCRVNGHAEYSGSPQGLQVAGAFQRLHTYFKGHGRPFPFSIPWSSRNEEEQNDDDKNGNDKHDPHMLTSMWIIFLCSL